MLQHVPGPIFQSTNFSDSSIAAACHPIEFALIPQHPFKTRPYFVSIVGNAESQTLSDCQQLNSLLELLRIMEILEIFHSVIPN
jgi:hypothetical protein